MTDTEFMKLALRLASRGSQSCTPNPQVGCVIVKQGEVVGRGYHSKAGGDHAEFMALAQAGKKTKGADIYVNLEPCSHTGRTPPCTESLIAAKPTRVVVACKDSDQRVAGKGIARLRCAGIKCEVGLLAREARWLNRGFFSRNEKGRPWVILKTASGIDGRIALTDGSSKWITSASARHDVHKLRSTSCAILTGSGTALRDDPRLNARGVRAKRQPLKVLVDGRSRCHGKLRMFRENVVIATASPSKRDLPKTAKSLVLPDKNGQVDLCKLLTRLAQDWHINTLLVEAGSGLTGALLAKGLIDEIIAYIAPRFLGEGPAVADISGGIPLSKAEKFVIQQVRRIGTDCRISMVRRDLA